MTSWKILLQNKNMNYLRFLFLWTLLTTSTPGAEFRLAWIFTDHMVIQRDKPVPVWGWATPGASVTVSCNGITATATAGSDGKWTAWLPAQPAGGPFTLTAASGGQTLTRTDVLIGDVWLVSGQSNAAFGLGSCVSSSNDVQTADINTANYPNIRFTGYYEHFAATPQTEAPCTWRAVTPSSASSCSAIGFYFARRIHTETGVPIGIILSSVGGTEIECWMPPDSINNFPANASVARNYASTISRWESELAASTATTTPSWQNRPAYLASAQTIGLNEAEPWVVQVRNALTASGTTIQSSFSELEAWIAAARTALNSQTPVPAPPEFDTVGGWLLTTSLSSSLKRIPLAPYPLVDRYDIAGHGWFRTQSLYNGMIHPLIPFTLSGMLWYQGENGSTDGEISPNSSYYHRFNAMVQTMRVKWGADFPVYYVQIANWLAPPSGPADTGDWPSTRWAQTQCLRIPRTGMAVTIDIGEEGDIHPKNKRDVGERLARCALANDYGWGGISSGPLFRQALVESNRIRISFESVGNGLMVGRKAGFGAVVEDLGTPLQHFAIAGSNRVWYWADAVIDGNYVLVSSPSVASPVAVRYAYAMNPSGCNLYNRDGLPASPFRYEPWYDGVPMATVRAEAPASREGHGPARFTIHLDPAPSISLTVSYNTANSTAIAGSDFTAPPGSIVFAAGQNSATVDVSILDDRTSDPGEKLRLTLAQGSGYMVDLPAWDEVAITDASSAPPVAAITAASAIVREDDGMAQFTVSLDRTNSTSLTLTYTVGGTASVGTDFTAPSGFITCLAGQKTATIQVFLLQDSSNECCETLTLTLASGTNYTLGTASAATSVIVKPATSLPDGTNFSVIINEIMFQPSVQDAEYIELFNTSSNAAAYLSHWRLDGVGYTFPPGTTMPPRSFLVLARNRTAFSTAYGNSPVFDIFPGSLPTDGAVLTLIKPRASPDTDMVVDQVKYENAAPWPSGFPGSGASLQLIDSTQDNSRVCNWSDGSSWRWVSYTGTPRGNTLYLYLDTPGEVCLDDMSLVSGTVAAYGSNFLKNGDFEQELANGWRSQGNVTNSHRSTSIRHSGGACLRLIAGSPAGNQARLVQTVSGLVPTNTYTLGFWYLPMSGSNGLTAWFSSSFMPRTTLRQITPTPGTSNVVTTSLLPIPPLWINEVLPDNLTGFPDQTGQREPWIELYNAGTNVVNLAGFSLANNYSNLTQWIFPTGSVINPGEFKVIVADGETSRSTQAEWHTNFRLTPSSGSVVLARQQFDLTEVLDYVNYTNVPPDCSTGSFPDGQPFDRRAMGFLTPGAMNDGTAGMPPHFLMPSVNGPEVTLRFTTTAGRRCRVQFKEDLSAPVWTDLTGDIQSSASSQAITNMTGNAQRFFRIVVLP